VHLVPVDLVIRLVPKVKHVPQEVPQQFFVASHAVHSICRHLAPDLAFQLCRVLLPLVVERIEDGRLSLGAIWLLVEGGGEDDGVLYVEGHALCRLSDAMPEGVVVGVRRPVSFGVELSLFYF
jgi:hypothetical protein